MSDDSRAFGPYAQADIDAMVKKLSSVMTVTGSNPWTLDTHNHGVVLSASYDASSRMLTVRIAAKNGFVPYIAVWNKVAPMMPAASVAGDDDAKSWSDDVKAQDDSTTEKRWVFLAVLLIVAAWGMKSR
jgi:hypothetical protein